MHGSPMKTFRLYIQTHSFELGTFEQLLVFFLFALVVKMKLNLNKWLVNLFCNICFNLLGAIYKITLPVLRKTRIMGYFSSALVLSCYAH
jgi:hypothetical protein